MLGSWYTPREIGKRAMIFWLAGSIGNMFSGFLQAAAYTNLNGVHGHAGCKFLTPPRSITVADQAAGRWLFIIDGIITLPLAVAGYFFFPTLPQDGVKTWWTTEREHEISIERMKAIGRAGKEKWTKAKLKSILLSWHTYFLRKITATTSAVSLTNLWNSYDLRPLEQRVPSARHGILAQELQRRSSSRTRHLVFRRSDQQFASTVDRNLYCHGSILGLAFRRTPEGSPMAFHLCRCHHRCKFTMVSVYTTNDD